MKEGSSMLLGTSLANQRQECCERAMTGSLRFFCWTAHPFEALKYMRGKLNYDPLIEQMS